MTFALGLGCTAERLADPAYANLVRDIYVDTTAPAAAPDPCPEPSPLPNDQGGARPLRKKRRSRRKCY